MRQILLIGTGKSTSYLINYLLERAESEQLTLILADKILDMIPLDFSQHPHCRVLKLDIEDEKARQQVEQRDHETRELRHHVSWLPVLGRDSQAFYVPVGKNYHGR